MEDTLPDTLSGLLTLALDDLAKCDADLRYIVDMGSWHEPDRQGRCAVCLAGAVMAKSLGYPHSSLFPSSFSGSLRCKMEALNCLRKGECIDAWRWLNEFSERWRPFELQQVSIPRHPDPAFVPALRALAASLKEAGL